MHTFIVSSFRHKRRQCWCSYSLCWPALFVVLQCSTSCRGNTHSKLEVVVGQIVLGERQGKLRTNETKLISQVESRWPRPSPAEPIHHEPSRSWQSRAEPNQSRARTPNSHFLHLAISLVSVYSKYNTVQYLFFGSRSFATLTLGELSRYHGTKLAVSIQEECQMAELYSVRERSDQQCYQTLEVIDDENER